MQNLSTHVLLSQNSECVQSVSVTLASVGQSLDVFPRVSEGIAAEPYRSVICDLGAKPDVWALRSEFPTSGILLLGNNPSDVPQLVSGLATGADDFILFPFQTQEFLARLEALQIRAKARGQSMLECGPLSLDVTNRRVRFADNPVPLTPTEFRILEILIRHSGHVVTRRMLCDSLWEPEWEGVTNVIEVHMNRLRTKLANAGSPKVIQTVRGSGYQFTECDSLVAHAGGNRLSPRTFPAAH